MKVLVTGGAGYVGAELVQALALDERVSGVVVYDNLSRKQHGLFVNGGLPGGKVRFVRGDILDTHRLGDVLEGIDLVYHLAARVSTPFAEDDPHAFEQVNHWGTAELSYALERHPARRVVYTSSASVYGSSDAPHGLDSPTAPRTWYGMSKLRGESMLTRLEDVGEVVIARCGNVFGYGRAMRFDAVINRFAFEAMFEGRLTIEGSGRQQRAFIEIAQLVRALVSLGLGAAAGGVYNLVTRNLSVAEIAQHVRALFPAVETLYAQQDMERRSLSVHPDPRLPQLGVAEAGRFEDQLVELVSHFGFQMADRAAVCAGRTKGAP